MPTFQYDPEAGDIARCPQCGAEGLIKRVYRGKIMLNWTHPINGMREEEVKWSFSVKCPFCDVYAVEKRWWRR